MQKSVLNITDEREEGDAAWPLGGFPLIDGCNYFIVELSLDNEERNGRVSMDNARSGASWNHLWSIAGSEPPGPLPEGAAASVYLDVTHPDCHVTTTVKDATRGKEGMQLEWESVYDPVAEGETRRVSLAVIIYPDTGRMRALRKEVDMRGVRQAEREAAREAGRRAKVSGNIQLLQQKAKKAPRLQ
jgi:hypothetical protein